MFPKRISVKFFTTCYVIMIIRITVSDCVIVLNENKQINFNLSAAVNFIMQSVNSSNVQVIGCNRYFQNDFHELSEHWTTTNVTVTLLNVDAEYAVQRKFYKNDFIAMFMDQQVAPRCLHEFLENYKSRIRKHKMVVIMKNVHCDDNGPLKELASFLWTKKIVNFLLLRDCNMTVDVHSYFPFANGKCREYSEENIVRLGTFYFNTSDSISFRNEYTLNTNEIDTVAPNYLPFYPNKVPLKLNNCEVIVSTGVWPPSVMDVHSNERGIEMDLVFALLQHMNASINVIVDPESWHGLTEDENAEHVGRLARLKKENFDLSAGSIPAHITSYRDFDTSIPYLPNAMTFIVPKAGVFPSSLILWSMLEKHTHLFVLIVGVVLFLSICINLLIQAAWKMRLNGQPKNSFFIDTMRTFLAFLRSLFETSTPSYPENRTIQWIYGMWFLTCLIISCYFNTTLISFFTEPGRLKQLETVQDIIDSNIPIAMMDLYYPLITADPAQEKYFISKNVNTSVMIALKLTSMGEAATFTDIMRADHIAAQWVSSSGEKSIHFITAGSLIYWSNVVLYRGNIFTERINDLVRRTTQSGYWDYQTKKYYSRRLHRIMTRQQLMVSNYHLGISNEELIQKLNKDFLDTSDSSAMVNRNETEKLFTETNEQEIIQRFVRTSKTLVTWDHLSTVFRLWAIGLLTAGICFVCELVIHSLPVLK